jgi:hypothetical protein
VASNACQALDQPKLISGSEQHFGWIRGGAGGESDRRVGLNRMGKVTPDINLNLTATLNPESTASYRQNDPKTDPTRPKSPKIGAGGCSDPEIEFGRPYPQALHSAPPPHRFWYKGPDEASLQLNISTFAVIAGMTHIDRRDKLDSVT